VTSVIAFEGDGRLREYAGGYSDYQCQRPAPDERRRADARPAPAKSADRREGQRPRPAGKGPQRELDRLLARIERLQASIGDLEGRLSDPDLFRRDARAFTAASADLGALRAELERAEQRWLELEIALEHQR
jgi:ATP-binding cassette subfamily F protein uup